eukprot:1177558-Prorocentrum_minimum.AAC.8
MLTSIWLSVEPTVPVQLSPSAPHPSANANNLAVLRLLRASYAPLTRLILSVEPGKAAGRLVKASNLLSSSESEDRPLASVSPFPPMSLAQTLLLVLASSPNLQHLRSSTTPSPKSKGRRKSKEGGWWADSEVRFSRGSHSSHHHSPPGQHPVSISSRPCSNTSLYQNS